jgi:hypothetical protein
LGLEDHCRKKTLSILRRRKETLRPVSVAGKAALHHVLSPFSVEAPLPAGHLF